MSSQPQTSGLAITALVLGVVAICMPLLAPVALVLGIVALNKIKQSGGAQKGEGLAIGGIVTGGMACVMIPILAAIAIPNFIRYQLRSKQSEARVNLNAMHAGAESYKMQSDRYPAANTGWVPAEPCGAQKCQPNPSLWSQPPWSEIGFSVGGGHYYQYRYESDGERLVLEAQADLDDDGQMGRFRLEGGGLVEDQNPGQF